MTRPPDIIGPGFVADFKVGNVTPAQARRQRAHYARVRKEIERCTCALYGPDTCPVCISFPPSIR